MKYVIRPTWEDYRWLWESWTRGMILSHLMVLSFVAFLILVRAYQAGKVSQYWPGVAIVVAIVCALLLTAAEYE